MPREKSLQNQRRLARQVEELDTLVLTPLAAECPEVAGRVRSVADWPAAVAAAAVAARGPEAAATPAPVAFDWDAVPASCHPGAAIRAGATSRPDRDSDKQAARAARKRSQIESFALVLHTLLGPPTGCHPGAMPTGRRLRVVDFGSGTGNLLLPLAAVWRNCDWVAVEMKPQPLRLLEARAQEAGLTNVTVFLGMIEQWPASEPFDVALGLHACGNATDRVMQMAVARGAAYILSPCCVGKLKFSLQGGTSFHAHLQSYTPQAAGDKPTDRLPVAAALEQQRSRQQPQHQQDNQTQQQQEAGSAGQGGAGQQLEGQEPGKAPQPAAGAGGFQSSHQALADGAALPPLQHPRSTWLRQRLPDAERHFKILARVADIAHSPEEAAQLAEALRARAHVAAAAKAAIELDRNAAAREEGGYATGLFKVLAADEQAKSDLLVGVPASSAAASRDALQCRPAMWQVAAATL